VRIPKREAEKKLSKFSKSGYYDRVTDKCLTIQSLNMNGLNSTRLCASYKPKFSQTNSVCAWGVLSSPVYERAL
jgi:hypothetical protein